MRTTDKTPLALAQGRRPRPCWGCVRGWVQALQLKYISWWNFYGSLLPKIALSVSGTY